MAGELAESSLISNITLKPGSELTGFSEMLSLVLKVSGSFGASLYEISV